MSNIKNETGISLILTLILTLTLSTVGIATLTMINSQLENSFFQQDEISAIFLAETGAKEAIWYLENVNSSWTGDSPVEHAFGDGTYTINITQGASTVITAVGYVPDIANERIHKTIQLAVQSSGGGGGSGGSSANGQYSHGSRYLSITNSSSTETTAFSTNEQVYIKYTTPQNCVSGNIKVYSYNNSTTYINSSMTEAGTDPYSYSYDFNTTGLGGADWYYIEVTTNSPTEKALAYIVTGTPATPHYFKTYSDSGYTTESDEFALDATIYVEVYGDDGSPKESNSKIKLYDYEDNKVIDEKPSNITKPGGTTNTYRFTVDLQAVEYPLVPAWYYSLEAELKKGGTTFFKGTKQVKILSSGITVDGQYTEDIRALEVTDNTGTQAIQFSPGDNITVNYTTLGICDDGGGELKIKSYVDDEKLKKNMTETANGDGTYTYSYTFNTSDIGGVEDWYYLETKCKKTTQDEKPKTYFIVGNGTHYIRTYSDSGYAVLADEFTAASTVYIEVYGNDGNPTSNKSKVKLKDYLDRERLKLDPLTTLTKPANNTYRASIDLSTATPAFADNWWYTLEVEIKEGDTKHFKGQKQIKIIPSSSGGGGGSTFTTTYWRETE